MKKLDEEDLRQADLRGQKSGYDAGYAVGKAEGRRLEQQWILRLARHYRDQLWGRHLYASVQARIKRYRKKEA